ncbi:MAG: FKBP-type peptidyl-prolyl cis-trans isomerase [Cyclobacteriaceae bacterium]
MGFKIISVLFIVLLFGCASDDSSCVPVTAADEASTIEEYLTQNSIIAQQTSSGLHYEITEPGTGPTAQSGDIVTLEVEGFLLDGRKFESTIDRGAPLGPFALGQAGLIAGLQEGIALLAEGAKATMVLPSSLAFGCSGSQGTIVGPNEIIVFEMEMLSICNEGNGSAQEQERLEMYLMDNNITTTTTSTGLQYVITEAGTGDQLVNGNVVQVEYEGRLLDGTVFDSSIDADPPFSFTLGQGQVIQGWDEGFALLKVGDKATLFIPSQLAYGCFGLSQGPIGGSETLIFTVEVLGIG